MAVVPAGLEMDWGCWTNSAGAGWGAQKSMTSSKGQVEKDETAGSEGMRKGEEAVGRRSAKDGVGPQHAHLETSSGCGPGSRR